MACTAELRIVLVKHQESRSGKALYVSDDGDVLNAVWVPKAMIGIDKIERGKFLVATMSKALATEKQLGNGAISHERLLPEEIAQLTAAQEAALLARKRYRGDRAQMSWHGGRNVFA